jgi:hypothetical protein
MAIGDKSDPGQVRGKDWRALAKAIGVGGIVADSAREMIERLPAHAKGVAVELEDRYGRMPVTALVVAAIGKRARRVGKMLKI